MGSLVPEGFDLGSLANDAERRVVEAFRDRLSDGWLVLPDVAVRTPEQDHQLDVVLIHHQVGVIDIEVKGHRVHVERGRWMNGSSEMSPQPPSQAKGNAYALRGDLRRALPDLARLHVHHGVALPNTTSVIGNLHSGFERVQVLTAEDLEDPGDSLEAIAALRVNAQPLTEDDVTAIVRHLRPDVTFLHDPTARMRTTRARLDELAAAQTEALVRLDVNRRVVALGAAGTGKTRLATRWAQRAIAREERVLLTCYNEPLAAEIADGVVADEDLTVGPFLRVALSLDGMKPLSVPDGADHDWWTIDAVGHIQTHWPGVTERFDTIVVDEAQDFSPAWLALLEALLDAEGPRRMLLLADPSQELYARGFSVPRVEDGWTKCELVSNCRNAREIGALLRRKLGGSPAPSVGPEAVDLRFVSVDPCGAEDGPDGGSPADQERLAELVQSEIDRLLVLEERDADHLMVLTFSSSLRDHLARTNDLIRWEERGRGIICENVHRMKGLEADTVVLVADRADVPEDLLYVGVSRAVSELVVIGPPALGDRLGLPAR